MSRPVIAETRSQLALQSYLDALLQDATQELEQAPLASVTLDEFQRRCSKSSSATTSVSRPFRPLRSRL